MTAYKIQISWLPWESFWKAILTEFEITIIIEIISILLLVYQA